MCFLPGKFYSQTKFCLEKGHLTPSHWGGHSSWTWVGGALTAVLGINLVFGVTQIPLCWLCRCCVSPRGCHCPMEQFCGLGSHPTLTHNDSGRFSHLSHRELHLLAPLSLLLFAYPTKYSSVTFKTKERDNYKGRGFFAVLKVNRILGICALSISM